jgi:hypothetical protein
MGGATQIMRDNLGVATVSPYYTLGEEWVNQNVTCHFLSIFELNFITKVLKKICFFCKMKIDKHFDYDFFSFTQEGVMRKAKSTGHNLMQQIDFKMKRVFVIHSI